MLDVGTATLHEVVRQVFALGGSLQVVAFKLRLEQSDERLELLGLSAVGRGGEEHQLLAFLVGEVFQQAIALLLILVGASRLGAGVRLVDDDEVGTMVEKHVAAVVLLDEVDGDDLEGNVAKDVLVGTQPFLQSTDRRGTDNLGIKTKLVLDFLLPLLAEVGQTDHGETLYLVAVEQFLGNEERLKCLADTHVVGDEQAYLLLLQGQYERHHLVRARLEGEPAQTLERSGNVAKRQSASVVEHTGCRTVTAPLEVGSRRTAEIV